MAAIGSKTKTKTHNLRWEAKTLCRLFLPRRGLFPNGVCHLAENPSNREQILRGRTESWYRLPEVHEPAPHKSSVPVGIVPIACEPGTSKLQSNGQSCVRAICNGSRWKTSQECRTSKFKQTATSPTFRNHPREHCSF